MNEVQFIYTHLDDCRFKATLPDHHLVEIDAATGEVLPSSVDRVLSLLSLPALLWSIQFLKI